MTLRTFIGKIVCRIRGHKGEWKQHHREWRLYRHCERCDDIEYKLKSEYVGKLSKLASRVAGAGYPELAKFLRKSGGDNR